MNKYKLPNGSTKEVPLEEVQTFLINNPDAILVTDDQTDSNEETDLSQQDSQKNINDDDKGEKETPISVDVAKINELETSSDKVEPLLTQPVVEEEEEDEDSKKTGFLGLTNIINELKEKSELRKKRRQNILDEVEDFIDIEEVGDGINIILDTENNNIIDTGGGINGTTDDTDIGNVTLAEIVLKPDSPTKKSAKYNKFIKTLDYFVKTQGNDMSALEYLESIQMTKKQVREKGFLGLNKFKDSIGGLTKAEWKEKTGSNERWNELKFLNKWYKKIVQLEERSALKIEDYWQLNIDKGEGEEGSEPTPYDIATYIASVEVSRSQKEMLKNMDISNVRVADEYAFPSGQTYVTRRDGKKVFEMTRDQYNKETETLLNKFRNNDISKREYKRTLREISKRFESQEYELLISEHERLKIQKKEGLWESEWHEDDHVNFINKRLMNDFAHYWSKREAKIISKFHEQQAELYAEINLGYYNEAVEKYRPDIEAANKEVNDTREQLLKELQAKFNEEYGENGERCKSRECRKELKEINEILNNEIETIKNETLSPIVNEIDSEFKRLLQSDERLLTLQADQIEVLKQLENDMWQKFAQEWGLKYEYWDEKELRAIAKHLDDNNFLDYSGPERKRILEMELERQLHKSLLTGSTLEEAKKEYWAYFTQKMNEDRHGDKTAYYYKSMANTIISGIDENHYGYEPWDQTTYRRVGIYGGRPGTSLAHAGFYFMGDDELSHGSINTAAANYSNNGGSIDNAKKLFQWSLKNEYLQQSFREAWDTHGIPHTSFSNDGELWYMRFDEIPSNRGPLPGRDTAAIYEVDWNKFLEDGVTPNPNYAKSVRTGNKMFYRWDEVKQEKDSDGVEYIWYYNKEEDTWERGRTVVDWFQLSGIKPAAYEYKLPNIRKFKCVPDWVMHGNVGAPRWNLSVEEWEESINNFHDTGKFIDQYNREFKVYGNVTHSVDEEFNNAAERRMRMGGVDGIFWIQQKAYAHYMGSGRGSGDHFSRPGTKFNQARDYMLDILNDPEKAKDLGFLNFIDGLTDYDWQEYMPVLNSVHSIDDMLAVLGSSKVSEDKREMYDDILLSAYSLHQQHKSNQKEISKAYNIGSGVGGSISFIFDMILSGGWVGAAKTAVVKGTKKGTERTLKKIVKKEVAEKIAQSGGAGALYELIGLTLATSGQAITNPGMIGRIAENTIKHMTPEVALVWSPEGEDAIVRIDAIVGGDEYAKEMGLEEGDDAFSAAVKGSLETVSELFTEQLGAYLPMLKIPKGISQHEYLVNMFGGKKKFNKIVKRLTLSHHMRKHNLTGLNATIEFMKKNGGWHGALGEMAEEIINVPLSQLAVGSDNIFEGIFTYNDKGDITGLDSESLTTILGSVGSMSVMFSGVNLASGVGQSKVYIGGKLVEMSEEKLMNDLLHFMPDVLEDLNIENPNDINWNDLDAETKQEIIDQLDIEFVGNVDYDIYVNFEKILDQTFGEGAGNDIINVRGSSQNNAVVIGDEIDIKTEATVEENGELETIESEENDLQNEIENLKTGEHTVEKSEKILNVEKKILELRKRKKQILDPYVETILKRKRSEQYKITLKKIKDINKAQAKNNRVNFIELSNSDDSRNIAREMLFGIKKIIKNIGRARRKTSVKEDEVRYVDLNGNNVSLTQEQIEYMESVLNEAETANGYLISSNVTETKEQIEKINEEIVKIESDITKQDAIINNENSSQEQIKKAEEQKRELEEEIKLNVKNIERINSNLRENSTIVINEELAISQMGGENVASHEYFHFFLRRTFDKHPEIASAFGRAFMRHLSKIDPKLIRNSDYRKRLDAYRDKNEAEQSEEAMALFLDGLSNGSITYNQTVMDKVRSIIRHIARRFGVNIKIKDGRDILNFLRDYQKNVERGEFEKGFLKTFNEGLLISGDIEFEISEVKEQTEASTNEMISNFRESYPNDKSTDAELRQAINEILSGKNQIKFSKREYDRTQNTFDKYITEGIITNKDFLNNQKAVEGVFTEIFVDNELDGLMSNIIAADSNFGGLAKNVQESIKEDLKLELWRKIQNEYSPFKIENGKPVGEFRSLFSYIYGAKDSKGLGGALFYSILNLKKARVEDVTKGAASLEITTSEGVVTREIEDETDVEVVKFEDVDILAEERARRKKIDITKKDKTTKGEIRGKLIENELEFSNNTKTNITKTIDKVKYEVEGKTYKDIKNDVIRQVNPSANTKNQVDPTGAFYPVIESISQREFGVDPKAVIAKRQNLTVPESNSARKKIAQDAKRLGPKKYIKTILGQFAQTPTGQAIGIPPTILRDFYRKGPRVPNLKGHVLNVDNMSNEQILNSFGINKDYSLMPHNRKFDGPVKGIITQSSVLAANQAVRVAKVEEVKQNNPGISTVEAQKVVEGTEISIGKPDVMFSKHISKQNMDTYIGKLGDVLTFLGNGSVNARDVNQVKFTLKEIYGKDLTAKEIRETAKEIVKWASKWESVQDKKARLNKKQLKELDISTREEMEMSFRDFFIRNTEDAFLDKKTFDVLGDKIPSKYKNFQDIYNDKSRIIKARAVVPALTTHMITSKKEGGLGWSKKKTAIYMFKYGQGMYTSSGKIHDRRWTIAPSKTGGPNVIVSNELSPNGKGDPRGQVFGSVADFTVSIAHALGFKGMSKAEIIEELEITPKDMKTLRDSSKAVLKNIKDNGEASTFKTSKKQAKEAQVFINAIGSYYGNKIKEGSLDYVDLAMLNKMFLSNMQAPIRKAAYVGWLGDGVENTTPENMGGDLEFEHMVTASVKTLEVMESIINNGKVDNSIYNDYTIAIIPSAMNDVLTENGLRNFMNIGWKKGDPPWRRYYNAQTLGDNRLVTIRSIDPKDKGIIDSKIQSFVNVSKIFNKKTIKRNKNILIAAKHKFSKSIKGDKVGMSTFDFDDTLARTKSGVRATIPNTDGKPKPKKKVIFLAGGAGSGKSNVVNKLGLEGMGMKIVNQDISLEWLKKNHGLPEDMRNLTKEQRSTLGKLGHQARGIAKRKMMKFQGQGDGVVVDGTGASAKNMQKLVDEFEGKGYDVGMIFVETSLETSLARNRARKERSLLDIIVRKNHEAVMGNKSTYAQVFGDRFMEVNTDNLTQKDPMPKELVNKANDFISGYEKVRLDAEEFAAKGEEILKKGGKFDFSEFNNVVDGSPGPLLDKAKARAEKYGTKDMFVLTARPAESAAAIQAFLKDQGLNIPIKNITGLANSTGEAKAQWMLEKFAEGYNDMYFVDDAIQNVEAVKEVLDQLDVKSDVVQAKVKFSKNANKEFNDMLERSAPEIKSGETISDVNAKMRARKISLMKTLKLNIFIPPSAEDFKGLLYNFLGEGKQGEKDLQFFKEHLLTPYAKANRVINNTKQKMSNEYADLKKNAKDVNLKEKVEGVDLVATNDMAVRVYLWTKAGFEIPGLSTQEQTVLVDRVKNDTSLLAFAEGLSGISRMPNGYIKPSNNWFVESIAWDLNSIANTNLRGEFLQEWKDNKDIIFSKENLNKIEAIHGSGFREALENMLYRMEHGKNRLVGKDSVVNGVLDWINGSVGATMFWNTRSAALQTISTVNFINWQDNNPLAVGKAFANQKQFWKDFSFIFNSDMLKQRRAGLQIDVSASELGNAFETGGRSASAIIGYLLQQGFTPTRIADSFAIAFGGASFYRNRFNKYIKEGMSEVKAKEKAFLDFQEIAEETQQSSRPDLISQQQAGILGRIVLAWQNTPMQMTRLTKKAISDLANNRGSVKSNISKILYYGAIQNLIFGTLQSGLAWAMFGDDDEAIKQREIRVANGMLDTLLRGTGIYGAAISTLKNTILQWRAQSKKGYGKRQDWRIAQEMVNISPPLGSKLRKIMNAVKTEEYNKGVGDKLGLRIENPNLSIGANIIEATTNIPAGRVLNKANNIEEAFTGNMKLWQRTALIMGWSTWDVGIKDEELEKAKIEVKEDKKIEKEKKRLEEKEKKRLEEEKRKKEEEERKKREGIKTVQCSGIRSNGSRCKLTTETKDKSWKCIHHSKFEDGMDRDNDGKPEYQCTATTGSGNRCKNKTENKNKKCYAHQ